MARIYDNIELKFNDGLNNAINSPGVKRVDFCVGYFNLRGWNMADLVLRFEDGKYALIECKGAKHLLGIKRLIQEYNTTENNSRYRNRIS